MFNWLTRLFRREPKAPAKNRVTRASTKPAPSPEETKRAGLPDPTADDEVGTKDTSSTELPGKAPRETADDNGVQKTISRPRAKSPAGTKSASASPNSKRKRRRPRRPKR
jgi:hypothetical protein